MRDGSLRLKHDCSAAKTHEAGGGHATAFIEQPGLITTAGTREHHARSFPKRAQCDIQATVFHVNRILSASGHTPGPSAART